MDDNENLVYDAIKMDPIEDLFDKIHNARGGEMFLIHVSKYGRKGPTIRVCSIMNKEESILSKLLPKLVENLLNE